MAAAEIREVLTDEQRRALHLVYEFFHRESRWPILYRLQHAQFVAGDEMPLLSVLSSVPTNLSYNYQNDGEVVLTARGVRSAEGPLAEELSDLVEVVMLCVHRYRADPDGWLSRADLHDMGMSPERTRRIYLLMQNEPFLWRGGQETDGEWKRQLGSEIWRFAAVRTIDDYFAKSDELRRPVIASLLPDYAGPEGMPTRMLGVDLPDAAPRFSTVDLHPEIGRVAGALYGHGYYPQAIFEAFKAVEVRVRGMSGIDGWGQDLMARALDGRGPIDLAVEQGRSGEDERQGFRLIFMGAMTGIRNPKAHAEVTLPDGERALEYLAFASLLMHRLDDAERLLPEA